MLHRALTSLFSNNLVINFKGSDDHVTITSYASSTNHQIEQILLQTVQTGCRRIFWIIPWATSHHPSLPRQMRHRPAIDTDVTGAAG
ncbi:calcium-binding protein [Citrobacter sp. Marseille-Q6884]|uniref:calcium-binding protein n=1 Tax=Citrobacter sp. Marseille-Q6884 TaxID=2956786 RepID=UPI00391F97FA